MARGNEESHAWGVSPIRFDKYLEQERERAEQRVRRGWSRAHARQNQLLPYGGSFLSPGDAERLRDALDRTLASAGASPDVILGAALLSSVMTSGRSVESLSRVRFEGVPAIPPRQGLSTGPDWTWWLAPGTASSPQLFGKLSEPGAAERAPLIPLPCSRRTRALISRLHPNPASGAFVFPRSPDEAVEVPVKMFGDVLRRYVGAVGVRTSTRQIQAWLFRCLILKQGGDAGVAAVITRHVAPITQTVLHYTAIPVEDVAAHVAEALAGFDTTPGSSRHVLAQHGRLGSRFAPTEAEVKTLATSLSHALQAPGRGKRRDPIMLHNAMTTYTIAFAHFATGCRPSRALLLDEEAIDPATGFIVLDDKPTSDNFKSRIVWVADDCREQLRYYRDHLQRLAERLPVNRRPKRTPYRRPKGTPFVERCDGYGGRAVRAGCGVGRA